jgi:hypothetical protein
MTIETVERQQIVTTSHIHLPFKLCGRMVEAFDQSSRGLGFDTQRHQSYVETLVKL